MTNIDEALDAAIANNTDEAVLGLDIGGTSIKMGVVTRVGEVLATAEDKQGMISEHHSAPQLPVAALQ